MSPKAIYLTCLVIYLTKTLVKLNSFDNQTLILWMSHERMKMNEVIPAIMEQLMTMFE